ncbi:MAG: hypothetical protein GQ542_05900 [Desulforhopalus sp.]|nr:hypothetical protein [Desulforhopalus sp.]
MNTSTRESYPKNYLYSMFRASLFVVLASLALLGCEQGGYGELETKIAQLENQANEQEKKIKILAAAVTRSRASVFDPPLKQFFDAPEFWEVVYEDKGACHNECYQQFQHQLDACDGDQGCETEAAVETAACHQKCDSPF